MQGTPGRAGGFTLIELLIVIVVIMVLVGLLMPTMYGTKKQAKVRQARGEITGLKAAIMNYKFTNREWPSGDIHNADVLFGHRIASTRYRSEDSHAILLDELTNDVPPHLDGSDFSIRDGKILDPWQTPYMIGLDSDYDGDAWVPSGNDWTNNIQGVVIWSYGPDRQSSFPGDGQPTSWRDDDVKSW